MVFVFYTKKFCVLCAKQQPLLGFGNVLMKGMKEAVQEQGFLGLFAGGFKAGAVGTSAALILGYLASLLSKPKMKE